MREPGGQRCVRRRFHHSYKKFAYRGSGPNFHLALAHKSGSESDYVVWKTAVFGKISKHSSKLTIVTESICVNS